MKKLLLFIPIVLMLNSCGPSLYRQDLNRTGLTINADADGWIERTIPPSQISTLGDMFFEEKLSKGGSFSVGGYIDEDSTYWYNTLYQDFGWKRNTEGGWSSYGGRDIKRGFLYINLKKGVSVYFYPVESGKGPTFNSFRVTINE